MTVAPPSRVRGLKLNVRVNAPKDYGRTPLTGAWIETSSPPVSSATLPVAPPSRVRGLKQEIEFLESLPRMSRTPLTGAWIETPVVPSSVSSPWSHPPHGCVD